MSDCLRRKIQQKSEFEETFIIKLLDLIKIYYNQDLQNKNKFDPNRSLDGGKIAARMADESHVFS